MRIEQLEYVAAVARLGSFRRAAQDLHISQPALSTSVRSLERELGVVILQRGRHGARVSEAGRDLLPCIRGVLDAHDRLREAASTAHRSTRLVRVATASTATVPLLAPAIARLRELHPATQAEIVAAQREDIRRGISEGSYDLGLANYLEGDDLPPELAATVLLRGRPVVCLRPDSPLAARPAVRVADLRAEALILLRPGYLMHRLVHRLLAGDVPAACSTADGAEMAKLLVAEGLGVTVLPDFSVAGDPLDRRGAITWRPLADGGPAILLTLLCGRAGAPPRAVRDLLQILADQARRYPGAPGSGQLPA
ncbi:MAG TPA: LysR family transcriptional regulator [Streptosporangiaceae bacterium]